MSAAETPTEQRLRLVVRGVAVGIFVMTPVELLFQEHTGGLQNLAYLACGLGLLGTLGVSTGTRGSARVRLANVVLLLVAGIAVFGLWEHFEHNYGFVREIKAQLSPRAAAWEALFGASPPLAPALLALAALLPLTTLKPDPE